jgi:hypothetical protein
MPERSMAAKIGKRRTRSRVPLAIASLVCVLAFSLAVRWLGLRPKQARPGEGAYQIEVLNGTGESRVAMDVAMELRRLGVDVLVVDNAERSDFKKSVLVDRKGNPRLMRELGKLLGCRNILQQIRPASLVDATYIVGYDRTAHAARRRS